MSVVGNMSWEDINVLKDFGKKHNSIRIKLLNKNGKTIVRMYSTNQEVADEICSALLKGEFEVEVLILEAPTKESITNNLAKGWEKMKNLWTVGKESLGLDEEEFFDFDMEDEKEEFGSYKKNKNHKVD